MTLDFEWLDDCDFMVRLHGVSPGADREELRCHERGIPVYKSIDEAIEKELGYAGHNDVR